jgi:hypothetical protein
MTKETRGRGFRDSSGRALLAAGLVAGALLLACSPPDAVAPRVVATYPAPGDTSVPVNARIQVAFSEPMDQASAESALSLGVAGVFSWAGDSILHFLPATELTPRTAYTLVIGAGARDLAGNRLDSARSVTFTTGDSTDRTVMLYMLGRSVMAGWFSHWGSDPYVSGRFLLEYHQVQPPPEIVASVQSIVDSLSSCDNPAVFFKFCFVDFVGGDSVSAQTNLDTNLACIQRVYDAVVAGRSLDLVIGNALPQVASATDPWLVWNHRQYNRRVADFAAAHPRVAVFNMYAVLADADGNLLPGYATSSDDSHPNNAGYVALDAAFFPFIEQHF